MTKEEEYELIKLSDLNREDNIKYISSEAQGIAITLDGDRYAPTFCKLERAYICGRRKSEKQLTKAIGIIKRWYETNRSTHIEPSQELIEVTEQFLKEIEKNEQTRISMFLCSLYAR